jgi:hypothetical protein
MPIWVKLRQERANTTSIMIKKVIDGTFFLLA